MVISDKQLPYRDSNVAVRRATNLYYVVVVKGVATIEFSGELNTVYVKISPYLLGKVHTPVSIWCSPALNQRRAFSAYCYFLPRRGVH